MEADEYLGRVTLNVCGKQIEIALRYREPVTLDLTDPDIQMPEGAERLIVAMAENQDEIIGRSIAVTAFTASIEWQAYDEWEFYTADGMGEVYLTEELEHENPYDLQWNCTYGALMCTLLMIGDLVSTWAIYANCGAAALTAGAMSPTCIGVLLSKGLVTATAAATCLNAQRECNKWAQWQRNNRRY
jgi:hypothetical protein